MSTPSPSPQTSPHTPHRVSPEGKQPVRTGGIAADQLRAIVERIERLHEEKAELASDITEVYAEAKSGGFDVKTLRKIIALRKLDPAERDETEHMLATYCAALGMQSSFNFGGDEA